MYSADQLDASSFVEGVDRVFYIILGFSFIFLIVITVLIIVFMIKYRKSKHPKAVQIEGNTRLEIAWTIAAVILVLALFFIGWAGYKPMRNIPDDAMKITAMARMWQFNFMYENGKVTDSLVVPVGQAVELDLIALDVIHSLYIPAFRVKEDMVPGIEKNMWFRAQREGGYDIFCAEYCGLEHSFMNARVRVLSDSAFQSWYVDTTRVEISKDMLPWQAGYEILRKNGCVACHTSDGSKLVGPSYRGIYGHMAEVETGGQSREVIVDSLYIRNSIFNPNDDIVNGYNKGLMLSYEGLVSDEEIGLIIEYLRHISQ
ncbi:MAG TPA: cytochrome c oxidase subunit II [Bacteroides sp.]|nr:cytochrome c oxidase subunit II [Bacteroides sp.]